MAGEPEGGAGGGGVTNDGLGRFRARRDLLVLLDLAFFRGGPSSPRVAPGGLEDSPDAE